MRRRCAADKPISLGGEYPSEWTWGSFFRSVKKRKVRLVFVKFSCFLQ